MKRRNSHLVLRTGGQTKSGVTLYGYDFSFLKEINENYISTDGEGLKALRKEIKFNLDLNLLAQQSLVFQQIQSNSTFTSHHRNTSSQYSNQNLKSPRKPQELSKIQEVQADQRGSPKREVSQMQHTQLIKEQSRSSPKQNPQVIQQTVVKQVTDEKTLQDITTLKRIVDFLKKENKSTQDDIVKGLSDLKRNFNTQLAQLQKNMDTQYGKQIQTVESTLKKELTEVNTTLLALITQKYDALDMELQALSGGNFTLSAPIQASTAQPSQTSESAQADKPQSSQQRTAKIDEGDIKRIVNATVHRSLVKLGNQIDEVKTQVGSSLKEVQNAMSSLSTFDHLFQKQFTQLVLSNYEDDSSSSQITLQGDQTVRGQVMGAGVQLR